MLCRLNVDQYVELLRLEDVAREAMAYSHDAWLSALAELMRYMWLEGLSPDHILNRRDTDFDPGRGRLAATVMKHPRDFPRGSMGYEVLKRANLLHLRKSAA